MKRFLLFVAPIVLLMGTIFFLSAQSQLPSPKISHIDKLEHGLAYGALGFLFARAFRGYGLSPKHALLAGICAASLYGASDEIHQMFTPGRSPDVMDWLADTIGATFGAGAWILFDPRRRVAPETSP